MATRGTFQAGGQIDGQEIVGSKRMLRGCFVVLSVGRNCGEKRLKMKGRMRMGRRRQGMSDRLRIRKRLSSGMLRMIVDLIFKYSNR